MKIILNSDILRDERLIIDKLPKRLQALFRACAKRGHSIVIPSTTLLECNRHQSQLVGETISQLENAYSLLDRFKIPHTRFEPSKVIKEPDLVGLIHNLGVEVVVEEPTIEDFQEAHKRACLHALPHPGDAKSDEMRDLLIWMIALRLALQDGGALLISRDRVHVNPRGDDEAIQARLVRVASIEEALEYFDVATPAGSLIEQLLQPVWNDLINAGLPVTRPMSLTGISQCRFVQGVRGPSFASCILKAKATGGETLQAATEIHADDGLISQVIVSDILVESEPFEERQITVTPNKEFRIEHDDYAERLGALKAIL